MWLRVWKTLSLGLGHFPKRLICLRDACHILKAQVEEKSHLRAAYFSDPLNLLQQLELFKYDMHLSNISFSEQETQKWSTAHNLTFIFKTEF